MHNVGSYFLEATVIMHCQNCGNYLNGTYCSNCGEKQFDKHELTVKHFFGEILESFFHFDNRFFKSLKLLLTKPGQLSLNFVEGRRVYFMKPLQLFLVLNICLFFIPGNPFSLPLYNYTTYGTFTKYGTKKIIADKIDKSSISLKEYTLQFDEKIKAESKEFIFCYIPFYAFILSLLFILSRRTIAEHLVFACHFMSLYMLLSILNTILIGLPFYYLSKLQHSQLFDNINTLVLEVLLFVYLFIAIRKFYKPSFLWALISACSISLTFIFILQYYRMLLFFKIVFLG